ncbi:hypothetical protein NCS52_01078500 [Fusarium sp. LHS14.1]|nr:hypothetical protein NCS52_01078500 [Fusarium sp. LHS14.1]
MEEYMQDLIHDLDEDALEIEHTPEADDLENPHTPDDDATVDEHTSDEDVPEDVVTPDEVVPPAPTTPDRPIQQHPLPLTVDQAIVEVMRVDQALRYLAAEDRDHLHRQAGPHMRRTRDAAAEDERARLNAELNEIAASVYANPPNANFVPTSNRTVSLSLATDETPDLSQTLAIAEDHVRSGRAECGREWDEAKERAEILQLRREASESITERRVRDLKQYRQAEHFSRLEQEMRLLFSEGVE